MNTPKTAAPPITSAPLPPPTPTKQPIPAVERLSHATAELARSPGDLQHETVIHGLLALASAIDALPSAGVEVAASTASVRKAAADLASSQPTSLEHADVTKAALSAAAVALTRLTAPSEHAALYRDMLGRAKAQIEAIDTRVALLKQRAAVVRAFSTLSDVVEIAAGQPPRQTGELRFELVRPHVENALSLVRSMAQERWDSSTRTTAADVLSALADALAVAPDHLSSSRISAIRFEANRLRLAESLSFGQSRWIRDGLRECLNGLEEIQMPDEGRGPAPWRMRAHAAVTAIDEKLSPTFQRAALQDAFRTVADAFAAWLDLESVQTPARTD